MKISKLIEELEKLKSEHGDLECGVYVSEYAQEYCAHLNCVNHVSAEQDSAGVLRIAISE